MRKKTGAKKTSFGEDRIEGMKLVLAHQQGKVKLEQVWPKAIAVNDSLLKGKPTSNN